MPRPTNVDETRGPADQKPAAGAARVVLDVVGILISLATAALPYVEKTSFMVLPVTSRIRSSVMPVAVLASVATVFAGIVTARQTSAGLAIGWLSLFLFLATTVLLYGVIDFWPRSTSALYIVFFASFSLAVTSFLSSRASSGH